MRFSPRENWRVIVLTVLLVASGALLFVPGVGLGSEAATGPTNLQYGLELSGGTRITAPLAGATAEEVAFGNASPRVVERQVADQLDGVGVADVTARPPGQYGDTTLQVATVEVAARNVSPAELGAALNATGYDYATVRQGVTAATRQQAVAVLRSKINEAGLSGGTVQTVTTATGQRLILIEVPNRDRSTVVDLATSRGSVRVDAYYPVQVNGTRTYNRTTVLTREDFQRIGSAEQANQQIRQPFVPVTIRESEASRFEQQMIRTGLASQGGTRCTYETNPNTTEPCLLLVVDGEVVNAFGMSPDLAQDMAAQQWSTDPQFVLTTRNFSEAQRVAINLRAGALPAPLDLDAGRSFFVQPALAENFKLSALITGLIAVLAVAGVVFFRYGNPTVAAPMVVTALSEVAILLGFAAAVGLALDLSHLAGFIAVIGTGVDDLIIIADEVMAEGSVSSGRVFQNRFRKAFWVIGAAAITTIMAMSPLAVLSLGDLRGFAIITILGVIVGVLITRPAYGDILRAFLTER